MATAKPHRELRVYQLASQSAEQIHDVTKNMEKKISKELCQPLTETDTEVTDTLAWRDFALHFGYLASETQKERIQHYDYICTLLTIILSGPNKWIPRTNQ